MAKWTRMRGFRSDVWLSRLSHIPWDVHRVLLITDACWTLAFYFD
jgi:hypothetical protein